MLNKRKRSITNFVVMFAFLFASMIFTIAAFSGTSEARFTSASSTDSIIIDTGNLDIIVTDNNGNPLGPVSFNDLDPSKTFQSDNYYIRITNNGSIPCKVRVNIANPYGDAELQNKVVARGYVSASSPYVSIGYNYISYSPKLFENKYLMPGETTEAYIKFFVLATSNQDFNVGFDLSIKAMQADNMDGYATANVATMTVADSVYGIDAVTATTPTPVAIVEPVQTVPATTQQPVTVTDAVYGNDTSTTTATTGPAITVEPVQTVPSATQQPEAVVTDTSTTTATTPAPAATVEPVQTVPSTTDQPVTVTDSVYGNDTATATTGSAITVDPVQTTVPSATQQPEAVVTDTSTTTATPAPAATVEPVQTVPAITQQPEAVVTDTSTTTANPTPAATVEPVQTVPAATQQPEAVVTDTSTTTATPTPAATVEPVQTVPATTQQPEAVVTDTSTTTATTPAPVATVEPVQTVPSATQQPEAVVTDTSTTTGVTTDSTTVEPVQTVPTTTQQTETVTNSVYSNDKVLTTSLSEPQIVSFAMTPLAYTYSDPTVTDVSTDPAINVDKNLEVQTTGLNTEQVITPDLVTQTQSTQTLSNVTEVQIEPNIVATQQTVLPVVNDSVSNVTDVTVEYSNVGTNITQSTEVPISSGQTNLATSDTYTSSENVLTQNDSNSYIVDTTNVPINPEQIIVTQSVDNVNLVSVTNDVALSNTSASTDVPINPEQIIAPISTDSTNLNKAIDQDIGTTIT